MTALLQVERLVKSFQGHRVVDGVSFEVPRGRIVALLGENGAGKTTLIKVLAGVYRKDSGVIRLDGAEVDGPGIRHGMSFVHQDLGLVDWMTVAENIAMTLGFPRRFGLIRWSAVREQAVAALEQVGGGIDPDTRVFDLPRTERSLLAIARGLASRPKLLVLDEPTASLPAADVERLLEVLRTLRESGVGMIYVSHRLDEVHRVADSVVVLRDGALAGTRATGRLPPEELVRLIVGRDTVGETPGAIAETVRLELAGVEVGDVGPVDLSLRAGEVVGLVGLQGAGQEEIGRAVAGERALTAGLLRLDGERFRPRTPADAVAAGIGFTTSDRQVEGVAAGLTVRENIFLNPGVWGRRMLVPATNRSERARAGELVREFGVRPAEPEVLMETLSGGNQQKVILARWFGAGRKVVVLEEPTIGVDVGAKSEIHALLRQVTGRGTSALLVSTDFAEVAATCHRALVFDRGRVRVELARDQLTTAALVAAVSGL